jgi:hypothetical protein
MVYDKRLLVQWRNGRISNRTRATSPKAVALLCSQRVLLQIAAITGTVETRGLVEKTRWLHIHELMAYGV